MKIRRADNLLEVRCNRCQEVAYVGPALGMVQAIENLASHEEWKIVSWLDYVLCNTCYRLECSEAVVNHFYEESTDLMRNLFMKHLEGYWEWVNAGKLEAWEKRTWELKDWYNHYAQYCFMRTI